MSEKLSVVCIGFRPHCKNTLRGFAEVRIEQGKVQYRPLFEFDSAAVRNAFSDAVIRAVLAFDPNALECRENAA